MPLVFLVMVDLGMLVHHALFALSGIRVRGFLSMVTSWVSL